MPQPFGLAVRFFLRDGTETAFDRLVEETVEQIRAREPGTLVYVTHTVTGRPNERVFYELYRDEAAFEEHERQEHVLRFLEQREQYVERFEVDRLAAITGKGYEVDGR
ncbi:hypothetical protein GCM10009799_03140 [Nocardiopsis rhodophaea]|uniref:ABM domain-containing protein n=1 Tax=Nocardiopsis rhodophaea TaxID=280238 RepID=A0ABN2S804_9ACTN